MNNLERRGKIPQKLWKLNKRKKVTIAIGLISKPKRAKGYPPTIFFASDSQTTYGSTKSHDAQKINVVNFHDAQMLVAQAGMAELSDKAIEIMRRLAKETPFEDSETGAKIARQAVREIRNHLYELNKGCVSSDEGWKRFFLEQNYFQLLIGYHFERVPFMFTVDIDLCMAIPVKAPYVAIGGGKNMGEFLLREYAQAIPDFEYGDIIAAAVVEKAIDNVDGCGRPTWMGYSTPTPEAVLIEYRKQEEAWKNMGKKPDKNFFKSECHIVTKESLEMVVQELRASEAAAAPKKSAEMNEIVRRIWEKRSKKNEEELKLAENEMDKRGMEYEKS
jgi:hypothetical protein